MRFNCEMAHHALQCLSQLASTNGAIFEDNKATTDYLAHFIQLFLDLIIRFVDGHRALHYCILIAA